MNTVNKPGMNLVMLLLLSTAVALFSQAPEKPAPKFALSIEEEQLGHGYSATDHELIVRYTNVSDAVQKDDCVVSPVAYKMVVLRDGLPAEKRKVRSEITDESQNSGKTNAYHIKVHYSEADSCQGITRGIDPGRIVKFTLWVSSEYDMTVPGTYEIAVTRETDRDHPEKSVTVKSNTLTVVVPQPGVGATQ
jgi:hypothetical protein